MIKSSLFLVFLTSISPSIPQTLAKSTGKNVSLENTIFAPSTNEDKLTYYSSLKEGQKGEEVLSTLQTILKKDQKKINFNSGNSTSKARDGYYLYERNYDLSPVEESELKGNYKKANIWINVLYQKEPIYIEGIVNSSKTTYKYSIDGKEYTNNFYKKLENSSSKSQLDREHVFPKSYGFNGPDDDSYKDLTAGCDAHNLHFGEHNGNSLGHSNYPYGEVTTNAKTIYSSLTGEVAGTLGKNADGYQVFEPLDSDKGDIARSIFYMAARYHTYEDLGNGDETPSLTLGDKITKKDGTTPPSETKNNPIAYGMLTDLLSWNKLDPVSKREITRNDLIYNSIQYNRNPFIDFPSWADACFAPSTSSGISFKNEGQPTYTLSLKAKENAKTSYYIFDEFQSEDYEVSLIDDKDNKINDFTYEFYLNGTPVTSKSQLFAFGKCTLVVKATYNGLTYTSNSIEILISASLTQVIIFLVICLVVIIILIAIIILLRKHKKNKLLYNSNKAYKKRRKRRQK